MNSNQYVYRTYLIGALVKKGALPETLWYDSDVNTTKKILPENYFVRLYTYNDTHDVLLSGGETHPIDAIVDKITDRFAILQEWTRKNFPIKNIIYRWTGMVEAPINSAASIGAGPLDKDNINVFCDNQICSIHKKNF